MESLTQSTGASGAYDGVEVAGWTIQALVDAFHASSTLISQMLLAEGIGQPGLKGKVEIDSSAWYPLDRTLRIIHSIAANLGDSILVEVGLRVAQGAPSPPWVRDVHEAIRSLDGVFLSSHRKHGRPFLDTATGRMGEGLGHYGYERVDERKIRAVISSPYPCPFDRGVLTARARRFQPQAWVFHDDSRPCRKAGARSCTYQLAWL